MPYIKKGDGRRKALRKGEPALNAGELNYQIFYYVKHYVNHHRNFRYDYDKIKFYVENFLGKKPNYQRYNDMSGCLIRCYKEILRRLNKSANMLIDIAESYDNEIARYEDKKIIENGDVE